MTTLYIFGQTGRIGQELVRLAHGHTLATAPEDAAVWLLATPTPAAQAILARPDAPTVIDLSGALKRTGAGRYGLLTDSGLLLDGAPPRPGDHLGNPGCIAASVIVGLQRAGLTADRLAGPIHVSSVTGASTAHRSQQGTVRLANRLLRHPHVDEIQQALPGVRLASFAPVIVYTQPRGILTVISGTLSPAGQDAIQPLGGRLELGSVLGTDRVDVRLTREGDGFTLGVVVDNLTFPAANAVRLVGAVGEGF